MSDPIDLTGISYASALAIQARMARKGIAPMQLLAYWNDDTDSLVNPMDEPDTLYEVRAMLGAIWRATEDVRKQHHAQVK